MCLLVLVSTQNFANISNCNSSFCITQPLKTESLFSLVEEKPMFPMKFESVVYFLLDPLRHMSDPI